MSTYRSLNLEPYHQLVSWRWFVLHNKRTPPAPGSLVVNKPREQISDVGAKDQRWASLPSIQETIQQHGLNAKKRLGQHFLLDPDILRRIVQSAGDITGRTILEVGPGPGGLSRAILAAGAQKLVAVEQDPRCIDALQSLIQASGGRMVLQQADAMRDPFPQALDAQDPIIVIANLPYNISAPLLVAWLNHLDRIRSMVLMFQKEVADRIEANHKNSAYGRLSVAVQSHCSVERLFDLPPGAFHPPPKVHSTVLRIKPADNRPDPTLGRAIMQVTASSFNQRRKMLRSSLKPLQLDVAELCRMAEIEPTARADAVSLAGYRRLGAALLTLRRETV